MQPRILIIEDDAAVRYNMESYLEDSGFEVLGEESGVRGIEVARVAHPDLILCDLRMPGLDGLDVLATLHAEKPELPLVVVSGTGVLSDAVEALRKGAWDFVVKPIQDLAILDHAIARTLEKARLLRENSRYQRELEQANRRLQEHLDQYQQDAAAGRTLQMQMMPPPERVLESYRFSRHLQPSLSLSGDFVDYFVIDAHHLGFYLADVSGHGVSSAFVTVLLKGFVERYLTLLQEDGDPSILDPARMLARLNRDFLNQRLDKYLTIFYGVIDTHSHRLSYSNGGHFPQPVLFDGESARFLPERDPPVGLFAQPTYGRTCLDFQPRHALAILSDGVLEVMAEGSLRAKRARLLEVVSTSGLATRPLISALGLDPEETYPDDITLLTVQRESRP